MGRLELSNYGHTATRRDAPASFYLVMFHQEIRLVHKADRGFVSRSRIAAPPYSGSSTARSSGLKRHGTRRSRKGTSSTMKRATQRPAGERLIAQQTPSAPMNRGCEKGRGWALDGGRIGKPPPDAGEGSPLHRLINAIARRVLSARSLRSISSQHAELQQCEASSSDAAQFRGQQRGR